MDDRVEQYLGQLTSECLAAYVNLDADTETTLRLVRRASGFLHELASLYRQRERQWLLMQEWSATGQDDGANAELLEASK